MPRPDQKVILYTKGMRVGPVATSFKRNQVSAKVRGRDKICPRCQRTMKDPTRAHKSDPYNNIPCIPKV